MTRHTFTAATYNVHEWIGKDGQQQPSRAIRMIEELDADVIVLQEVSFSTKGTHLFTIEDLSLQTRMLVVPGLTLTKKEARFGNVLMARHSLISLRKLDLSIRAREPRGAIMATLDIHGSPCMVIGTHLGLQRRERFRQIQMILEEIETHPMKCPIILMGDFNEWNAASGTLRILRRYFGRTPAPLTYPSRFPILSLDRILVHPGKSLQKLVVSKSPLARLASDHLPVRATVRFPF